MNYVFEPPDVVSMPVAGRAEAFPVHRVYCVGRNYAAHAREMGADPEREPPFFFCKPADALVALTQAGEVPYPSATRSLHHEIELVVALGAGGRNLDVSAAAAAVFGCAVGVDLTRRDLQAEAKKLGRPWDTGKAFDHSAPVSPLIALDGQSVPARGRIWLEVNGDLRQEGDLSQMIWTVPEVVATLSTLFELRAGDLVFTGTPAGVGALESGDRVDGGVEGFGTLSFHIR
ncbi:fumarylacetoacetate hydrolase family protein [Elongatibacter sediminis]|uniref:Fumarylacetoacetate hydrolase family protein n=1 Tax=Elongatibacter sediminis TaxID=3119006 RepID=A0AAW9RG24_9GAMM